MHRIRGTLAVTLLVLSCAACSGQSDPSATATNTTATRVTPPTTGSPSPTVPADLAKYTPAERLEYRAAVRAYSVFATQNSQFLVRGQLTKSASRFYHRYSINWVRAWANLAQLNDNGVTVTGRTRLLWIHPKSIQLTPTGSAVVVLRRCLDESQLRVVQRGKGFPDA